MEWAKARTGLLKRLPQWQGDEDAAFRSLSSQPRGSKLTAIIACYCRRWPRYAPALTPGAGGYAHLDELIHTVQDALMEALEKPTVGSVGAAGKSGAGQGPWQHTAQGSARIARMWTAVRRRFLFY